MRELEWTPDCQGKWDYDGDVLRVSSRYWPSGGGFHILDKDGFRLSTNPAIKPSAVSHILFNDAVIVERKFEGDTEGEVKSAVEAWVSKQLERIRTAIESIVWEGRDGL